MLMASPQKNIPLSRDLALIYVALAQGADQDLDASEERVILERLHTWEPEASEAGLRAMLQDALKAYLGDPGGEALAQAVQGVRERASSNVRSALLEDLMAIALADARFLFKESDFIGRLAKAWEVRPPVPVAGHSWNVMQSGIQSGRWTPVHDLALIFLAVAYQSDAVLERSELDAIARKVKEWLPEATEGEMERVLRSVLQVYAAGPEVDVIELAGLEG
jgi:hypothetical protein